ncbi:MAG: vitamin K epoxide reductase family protein [Patescibacteria group bacterium]
MAPKQKIFLGILVLGSLIGLLDTSYLAILQLKNNQYLSCDFWGFSCDKVLNSVYSKFLGIPLSFWGLGYYLTLFFGAAAYLSRQNKLILRLIELWVWLGAGVSLILVYLQAAVLKAFCLYCLISELVIFTMMISYLIIKFLIKSDYTNQRI